MIRSGACEVRCGCDPRHPSRRFAFLVSARRESQTSLLDNPRKRRQNINIESPSITQRPRHAQNPNSACRLCSIRTCHPQTRRERLTAVLPHIHTHLVHPALPRDARAACEAICGAELRNPRHHTGHRIGSLRCTPLTLLGYTGAPLASSQADSLHSTRALAPPERLCPTPQAASEAC